MAQQERTEKATGRRRQRARDQGQFAYSQELTSAITVAACAAAIFYVVRTPAGFRSFFSSVLEQAQSGDYGSLVHQAGIYFLAAAAPAFAASVLAALAGNLLQ